MFCRGYHRYNLQLWISADLLKKVDRNIDLEREIRKNILIPSCSIYYEE